MKINEPEPEPDQQHISMCFDCGQLVLFDDYQEPDMFCIQCGGIVFNI